MNNPPEPQGLGSILNQLQFNNLPHNLLEEAKKQKDESEKEAQIAKKEARESNRKFLLGQNPEDALRHIQNPKSPCLGDIDETYYSLCRLASYLFDYLKSSQDEIRKQNQEIKNLKTKTDYLTRELEAIKSPQILQTSHPNEKQDNPITIMYSNIIRNEFLYKFLPLIISTSTLIITIVALIIALKQK